MDQLKKAEDGREVGQARVRLLFVLAGRLRLRRTGMIIRGCHCS